MNNMAKVKNFFLYMIFLLLMVFIISQKQNLHVDEVWSYVLANTPGDHDLEVWLQNGVTHTSARELFTKYMGVEAEERFDYRTVWDNQRKDVHPPLYYAILHTICSLLPGVWSKWMAAAVNIFAALWVLYFFRRLVSLLCDDALICSFLSVSAIFLAGFLHAITFFRMYILAMVFVIAATEAIVGKAMESGELYKPANSKRIQQISVWIRLWFCIFLGALTHYYCTLYMILLSVVWGVYFLCNRRFKEVMGIILTSTTAGLSAILVFPYMIDHVLHSNHGVSAQSNLQHSTEWIDRLRIFYRFINNELFGGLLGAIVLAVLFLMILCWKTDHNTMNDAVSVINLSSREMQMLLTGIVCSVYFFLVAILATLKKDRYLFPIYLVVYALVLCAVFSCLKRALSISAARAVYVVILAFILSGSLANTTFTFLYKDSAPAQAYADRHPDAECIIIYGGRPYYINSDIYVIMRHDALTAYQQEKIDIDGIVARIENKTEAVIEFINVDDEEAVLEQIMERLKQKRSAKKLHSFTYGNSYRIYITPLENNDGRSE